jgi:hypothetical protein
MEMGVGRGQMGRFAYLPAAVMVLEKRRLWTPNESEAERLARALERAAVARSDEELWMLEREAAGLRATRAERDE